VANLRYSPSTASGPTMNTGTGMCGGRLQPRSPRGAYRWVRESASHDDAIYFAFAEESEDLIGGQAGTGNDFASDAGIANMLREGLEAFDFGACRGGIVVIANPRGFRGRDNQGVIRVEEDEIGANSTACARANSKAFSLVESRRRRGWWRVCSNQA